MSIVIYNLSHLSVFSYILNHFFVVDLNNEMIQIVLGFSTSYNE